MKKTILNRISMFVLLAAGQSVYGTESGMSHQATNAPIMTTTAARSSESQRIGDTQELIGKAIALPPPRQTGGMPLLDALKNRHSTRSFSDKALSLQTLSDLLWAGFGVNRPKTGMRTAPSSYNWQDITLYVFTAEGVWTYDAVQHVLRPVKTGDHRKLAGMQSFVWEAPLSIVYVSDFSKMKQGDEDFPTEYKLKMGGIDAGHISQNVYLFCVSEGLGVVARASVDPEPFVEALGLTSDQKIMLGQTIGWPTAE